MDSYNEGRRKMNKQTCQKDDPRKLPLPKDWFLADEEDVCPEGYKDWIYHQQNKRPGEIPCFIFTI